MAGRHIVRRGKSIRKSAWIGFQHVGATLSSASSTLIFSLNAAALALRPFTIVRTHFSFFVNSDQAAANEQQAIFWGAAVVSDQAVSVGITAVPTPNTDLPSSLFFALKLMYANAVNLTDQTKAGAYFELDSKAMRKVDVGSDIIVVVENPLATGVVIQQAGRMLVKTN